MSYVLLLNGVKMTGENMNTNYSLNLDNAVDLILNTTPDVKKYKVNLGFSKIPKELLNLQLHKMFDRSYHTENDNFAEISVRKGNIIKNNKYLEIKFAPNYGIKIKVNQNFNLETAIKKYNV